MNRRSFLKLLGVAPAAVVVAPAAAKAVSDHWTSKTLAHGGARMAALEALNSDDKEIPDIEWGKNFRQYRAGVKISDKHIDELYDNLTEVFADEMAAYNRTIAYDRARVLNAAIH